MRVNSVVRCIPVEWVWIETLGYVTLALLRGRVSVNFASIDENRARDGSLSVYTRARRLLRVKFARRSVANERKRKKKKKKRRKKKDDGLRVEKVQAYYDRYRWNFYEISSFYFLERLSLKLFVVTRYTSRSCNRLSDMYVYTCVRAYVYVHTQVATRSKAKGDKTRKPFPFTVFRYYLYKGLVIDANKLRPLAFDA